MYEEIFAKTTTQLNELFAPAKKFNSLLVDSLEKLTQYQLEAAKCYADLGVEQLRAALEINDAKSLQDYVSKQQKVAETVGQKISEDASTLATLGKDFSTEVQKLAQENVTFLSQFAQNKAKAAAPKAAPARKSA